MSRHEADREDLFAEATALTTRIELMLPGDTQPVVAGCRPTGAWSIYFGGDPCYHFDADRRLRRAFAGGDLYRTQGDTLARLNRERTDDEIVLQRSDLRPAERAAFVEHMQARLSTLLRALQSGEAIGRRRHPEGANVQSELQSAIERILAMRGELAPAIAARRR
jgi:hypothetical protein